MSTETAVYLAGTITLVLGVVFVFLGAVAAYARVRWLIQWKLGDTRNMQRAARLGWNTGPPPDGSTFLVLEWMKEFPRNPQFYANYQWSIMVRRGNRCETINGGMSTPVENITGWLEIDTRDQLMHPWKEVPGASDE